MGLLNQLNDVSSDSIPLLIIAVIANSVAYVRSLLFKLFECMGLIRFSGPSHLVVDDGPLGSGLAGLIVLTEQLNLNRVFSYEYCGGDKGGGLDCVVCLSTLRDGEQVRKLDCHHVFHKNCFDGWLDHLNFNCPLCRSPVVSDERVDVTRRRVGSDLMGWFSSLR